MMQIWETSCLEGNCAQPLSRRLLWVSVKSIKGAIVPEITRCPHMEGLCGILWSYSILFVYDLTLNNASLCYLCYFSCPWHFFFFFKLVTKCFLTNHMSAIHLSDTLHLHLCNRPAGGLLRPECDTRDPCSRFIFVLFPFPSAGEGVAWLGLKMPYTSFLGLCIHPMSF